MTTDPKAEYHRYLVDLGEKARDASRWGAALSKSARGKLSGHWMTPPNVLVEASTILEALGLPSTFTLDIAADPGSAVAPDWFGLFHLLPGNRNALAVPSWVAPKRGAAWLNPDYGQILDFAKRAAEHDLDCERKGIVAPLMFLAFARLDTKWLHRHVLDPEIPMWVHEGRLKFIDPLTGMAKNSAPVPSFLGLYGIKGSKVNLAKAKTVGRWKLLRGGT